MHRLVLLGLNHATAPLEVRESLRLTPSSSARHSRGFEKNSPAVKRCCCRRVTEWNCTLRRR